MADYPVAIVPDWVSYASIAVAALSLVCSVVLGVYNRAVAKAALEISRRQEARRESRLDLYVNDTAQWRCSERDRLLGVNLQVANPTDRETSVTRAELHLTYAIEGRLAAVKVLSSDQSPIELGSSGLEVLSLPLRLAANEARSGWFLFFIPQALIAGREVDRYDVVLRDLHEIEQSLQVTIFREAQHESRA
ncbi:MAG TPA: hypothetical protein VF715_06630 [Thermoleophilaceae bacterium]|jgi:hypothetical protein